MKYRTTEQFEEIVDSCLNGNWSQAADECVEYGYYANDLILKQETGKNETGVYFEDDTDMVLLIEMATDKRHN